LDYKNVASQAFTFHVAYLKWWHYK